MKLGLLLCDHSLGTPTKDANPSQTSQTSPTSPTSIDAKHGDYDEMFRRWLPGDWKVYDLERGERPRDLDECDAWLTTGSSASVYDDVPWIHGFADFVREIHDAGKPFVGVCFGHQMMAHALGGKVARSTRGWQLGVQKFRVAQPEAWMRPSRDEFAVLMSCQDQVETLPPGAKVLAGNERCPVALYRVGSMLGIQGHPEWAPSYAKALLDDRSQRIGKDEVAAAAKSLDQSIDGELIAQWADRFLQSARSST